MLVLLWIFWLLLISTAYAYGTTKAPLVFSPKNGLKAALTFINPKKGSCFFDLGCGSGRSLIIAEKEFGLRSTGFELATTSYLICVVNIFLHKLKNSRVVFRNLYIVPLKKADIVFCFLNIKAMKKLEEKFELEMQPGSWLISYCFALEKRTPTKVIALENQHKFYLYKHL